MLIIEIALGMILGSSLLMGLCVALMATKTGRKLYSRFTEIIIRFSLEDEEE